MSTKAADVVVIGAGIVGAACAWEFAREGMSVTLIDSGAPGGGATAAGMGHVAVMDDSEPQFALTRYSQQLWREIVDELPDDCEYETCGTLWIAADDEELAEVRRKQQAYTRRGIDAEVLDAAALARAEPNLRSGLAGALRVPGDLVVFPPCVARWLIAGATECGAQVRLGTAAVEISDRGVRLADDSLLPAGAIINATGHGAERLTPGLSLQPRKGHLAITDRYPGFIHHELIELGYLKSAAAVGTDSAAMNVQPRITGQMLIGSSRQTGQESTDVDMAILGRMLRRAMEYLPALARVSTIRTWTGFRAATADKLPLIGRCSSGQRSSQGRLYLATGHEGLGITMAPGTARLLVDAVMGRESAIPPEPYLPARLEKGDSA
ncbi:MAG: FAD-dependent oxidoreductase [Candidatus Nealsonbacteria bacterium]|nr:FAD-dependent oxidoreductase [Candidatus Nealsonbacteria bacterium]